MVQFHGPKHFQVDSNSLSTAEALKMDNYLSFYYWVHQYYDICFYPGFSTLPMNEQMRLLQGSWGEIITLSIIYRSLNDGRNDVSSSSFSEEAKNTVSSQNGVKEQQSSFNSVQVKLEIIREVSFY